jgi:hypothetical protein
MAQALELAQARDLFFRRAQLDLDLLFRRADLELASRAKPSVRRARVCDGGSKSDDGDRDARALNELIRRTNA